MLRQPDYSGQKFYKLKVIGKVHVYRGLFRWVCLCECGNKIIITGSNLKNGYKKSCGCWHKPRERSETIEQRFFKYVKKTKSCWNWIGSLNHAGYGQFFYNGRPIVSSRYSWIMHHKEIPKGLFVLHKCDNPKCVNPKHLFLGTQIDNIKDCIKKKRSRYHKGEEKTLAKITENDVKEIRNIYNNPHSASQLGKLYGISKSNILNIVHRKAWKHVS